jgi:hypothetical protein
MQQNQLPNLAPISPPALEATEIKPRPWRLAVPIACAFALGIAGDAILWDSLQPGGSRPWSLAGLALLLSAVGMLLAVCRLAALRLWLSPRGFVVATRGESRSPFFVGHVAGGGEESCDTNPH